MRRARKASVGMMLELHFEPKTMGTHRNIRKGWQKQEKGPPQGPRHGERGPNMEEKPFVKRFFPRGGGGRAPTLVPLCGCPCIKPKR